MIEFNRNPDISNLRFLRIKLLMIKRYMLLHWNLIRKAYVQATNDVKLPLFYFKLILPVSDILEIQL